MTRKEAEARTEFENILLEEQAFDARRGPERKRTSARNAANLLCRHGRTYARIQEALCNGPGVIYGESNESFNRRLNKHEQWVEKRNAQLQTRITAICEGLGAGFVPVFNGDPRGATVKIRVPSGRTNDWGGVGICVPTS
jgi:hypothetical protein